MKNKECYLDGNYIVLNVVYPYEIEISRCDTPEKILHWCSHLCDKTWVTAELISKFIALACGCNKLDVHQMCG